MKKGTPNFIEILKDRDMFGKEIRLTHQGRETYQTIHGGIASIIFFISMAYFAIHAFWPILLDHIDSFQQMPRYLSVDA
jgi:hypothetical protein